VLGDGGECAEYADGAEVLDVDGGGLGLEHWTLFGAFDV
jgi:hypothetical protein